MIPVHSWLTMPSEARTFKLDPSQSSGRRLATPTGLEAVHQSAIGYMTFLHALIIARRRHILPRVIGVLLQRVPMFIGHPPPPAIALCLLKNAGDKIEQVDTGITAQVTEYPGSNVRFINARNWLSLTVDEQERVWAEWFAEGESAPYPKVVLKH